MKLDKEECSGCEHIDQCFQSIRECTYFTAQDAAEPSWPRVYQTTAPAIIYEQEAS